jgi:AraC-like DNA-binding protein
MRHARCRGIRANASFKDSSRRVPRAALLRSMLPSPQNSSPDAISCARSFIDQHFGERLTLDELSRATSLSRYYLCRAFKKAHGVTVGAYLTRRRIEEAQRLLADRTMLVKQVAFVAGFQSVAHFNRIFKAATGVAPSEFRRQLREPGMGEGNICKSKEEPCPTRGPAHPRTA